MELLFLWISKYGSIKEQGFNLSGEYKFSYNQLLKHLIVEENNNYIKGFFNKNANNDIANILNVTAIVGANGAGKSTFLDFIKNNIPYGIGGINVPCIIILRDTDGNKLIYHHEDIKIKSGNYKQYEFKTKPFRDEKINNILSSNYEIPNHSDVSYIFFSNIFDNKEEQSIGNLHNISTNYLIKGDKKALIETNLHDYSLSEIKAFQHEEVRRQLIFIGEASNNSMVPFPLPENLYIRPVDLRLNQNKFKKYGEVYKKLRDTILNHYNSAIKLKKLITQNRQEEFRFKFYNSLILNFFYELENYNSHIIEEVNIFKNLNNKDNIYKKIYDMFLAAEVSTVVSGNYKIQFNITKFVDFIEEQIKDNNNLDYNNNLILNVSNSSRIESFLTLYQNSFLFNQYMEFSWTGLSSGQQALFNLLARFYSISDFRLRQTNTELKRNIIILIDEGELYFHPQWQKQLLNLILEFLPRVLSSSSFQRNIQIIITSNSPFILSDLPSENVIFLQNNGNSTTVVNKQNGSKTFGANIYSLYSDSFFIQDGLMGDFVKQKIKDVVSVLLEESTQLDKEKEDSIKKIINIIAEPVIKNKLLSLYNEMAVKNRYIDDEIFYLENRLKTLKDIKDYDKN